MVFPKKVYTAPIIDPKGSARVQTKSLHKIFRRVI